MDKLREIVHALDSICLTMKVSDEKILEQAVKIFLTDKINESEKKPADNKATPKQLALLKRLGYKGSQTITKKQASEKIKELKEGVY